MQVAVNGLIQGLSIAALAVAFSAVFIPTRVFYIGLAGVFTVCPYVAMWCMGRGVPLFGALAVAATAGLVLSLLCEICCHRPLENRGSSAEAHMLASIGVYIVLSQSVALIWGNKTRVLPGSISEALAIDSLVLSSGQVVTAVVAVVLLLAFGVFLRFSTAGLQFRALAENRSEFALRGHSAARVRMLAFAISGLMAAAVSLGIAYDTSFGPNRGLIILLPAIVATIVGGRMTFVGPVVGGILLGIAQSGAIWHLSARWQDTVTAILLITFLVIRPKGIFSPESGLESAS